MFVMLILKCEEKSLPVAESHTRVSGRPVSCDGPDPIEGFRSHQSPGDVRVGYDATNRSLLSLQRCCAVLSADS
jgi:hypothetical protein